ncbi:MAG: hypothetical protein M9935_11165 [Kiritimatiellae bacterium]|nr:hypothetical protein [Kiritimatiellia bacterium]
MRILSGIQPSGRLHLGNYFGMMRPALSCGERGLLFHCELSRVDDGDRRRGAAAGDARCGAGFPGVRVGPIPTVFYRQSDVPEVTELTWLLR